MGLRRDEVFIGFSYHNRFCIASPEKAILDTLYYRGTIPAPDELELDRVDFDLLSRLADGYPNSVSRYLVNISGILTQNPKEKNGLNIA